MMGFPGVFDSMASGGYSDFQVAQLRRYHRMQKTLVAEGRTHPIEVLPTDLERFDLPPWEGKMYGMTCVDPGVETA